MATKLSVTQIKADFERLMERVSAGQVIIVTRYGRPVARLIPPGPRKRADAKRKGGRG